MGKPPGKFSTEGADAQILAAQLAERNSELAMITRVIEGLVARIDIQGIYELVGDKIHEIFDAQVVDIGIYNENERLFHFPYIIERGVRFPDEPLPMIGFRKHVMETGQHLLITDNIEELSAFYGNPEAVQGEATHSVLFVPLVVGGETRGVISLQNIDREYEFSASDVTLLQTLVNSMSVALENARLFDETQKLLKGSEARAQELAAINTVSQALVAEADLDSIIQLIGSQVKAIFDADIVYVALLDGQTGLIHFPYQVGETFTTLQRGEGHTGRIIATGQALLINEDVNERSRSLGVTQVGRNALSYLGVPIQAGGETIGVISVQSTNREGLFTEDSLRLLTTIAANASAAIQSAKLHNETRRRFNEAEILRAANMELTESFDLDTILDTLLDYLQQLVPYDTGSVFLLEDETHLTARAACGYDQWSENADQAVGIDFEFEKMPHIRQVIRGQKTVIIPDVTQYPYWVVAPTAEHVRNWLAVPLIAAGKTIGMFSLDKAVAGFFTPDHQRLAQHLASQAAIALQNARLYQNQKTAREQAETLQAVTQALSQTLSLQEVFGLILSELQKVVPYDSCSVQQLDGDAFVIVGGRGFPNLDELLGLRFKFHAGDLNTAVITTRQPYIVDDVVARFAHFKQSAHGGGRIHGWMGIPLIYGDQMIGMLALDKNQKNFYTQEHAHLAMSFAAQAAVAIENARLFETERAAREQAEAQTRQMAALNRVAQAITSTLDLQTVLEIAAREMVALLDARSVGIGLLDAARQELQIVAYYSKGDEPSAVGLHIPVEGNPATEQVIAAKKPVLVVDAQNTSLQNEATRAVMRARNTQCMLIVPLLAHGEVIGTLAPDTDQVDRVFTAEEVQLAETIAHQMAGVIENARLFKEAEAARAAAEQANRAKSTFLANMSHELRTPLNAIIGFTRIVRRKAAGALPEKQLDNLDKVLSSSEHLLGLINTVLDIAKIEAGRVDVIPAKFHIATLIDQCANLAAPLLKPGVRLDKQVDETLGLITSDQDKIKQIVINLLSNAAKFTHAGAILLAVQKLNPETLSISVTDSGIGISEEALGRIFEEFQQADTSTTRQYGGTGLGLSISRSLARLLGGDLTAASQPGQGSTFTLTLPIEYGRTGSPQAAPETTPGAKASEQREQVSSRPRVLVIDDDPNAVYLLQEGLAVDEYEFRGAHTGQDGLRMAREQQPDAILLDILFPETDGWQILNDLKSDPVTAHIPVILLTIVDKKTLGFKLGAAEYLLKPLDPILVLETLRRVAGEQQRAQKTVLVVDDDPNVVDMLRQSLPASEFILAAAEDGQAGLEAIRSRRPDVILLDLMMPRLDGFGVIEVLRSDPEMSSIPVIVISAKHLSADESKLLRESAAFVMQKQGFDSERLKAEIDSVLKQAMPTG